MTDLRKLLEESGVRSVMVIDDVFDDVPRSTELTDDDWNVFFDDLSCQDEGLIVEKYPQYENTQPDELKRSDRFVGTLWEHRGSLTEDARESLFGNYEKRNFDERQNLDNLVRNLERFGLRCDTMGTDTKDAVKCADLLIVDLFLGLQQHEEDVDRTVELLQEVVKERNELPLVVLMSRSGRLENHKDRFRDSVGLLGSMFRVVRKREIFETANLGRLLRRLAVHYQDAKIVDRFIRAWNTGMDQAKDRLIKKLRRLDLSDLAQIRDLMLKIEGQDLGEYMMELADRVLQYEIEAVEDTINAAIDLNSVDLEKYPAPHLAGTADLQEIVYQGMFLDAHRLRSSDDDSIELQFGDVIRWEGEGPLFQRFNVFLVVTPACDLARSAVDGVVLLPGTLQDLEPTAWSYKQEPVRTPVVIHGDDEQRSWIRWDLKAVRAVAYDTLRDKRKVERIGRLREIHAIDLQQKMLAILGRVGTPASPPVAFAVEVSFYYVDSGSMLKPLDGVINRSAACYVGRDAKSNPIHRLVLGERDCDKVDRELQGLSDSDVRESLRVSLLAIRNDRSFFDRLERGEIEVPLSETRPPKPVDDRAVAVVFRNGSVAEGSPISGKHRKAVLIIQVVDVGSVDV